MFVYADESGNTGRNLFDEKSRTYRLGGIFTVADAEPAIESAIRPVLAASGEPRLHAKNMQEGDVSALAHVIMDALDTLGPWRLSMTVIDKPYLATTKFVDLVFDSGENAAVPPLWYNLELFRHAICIAVDDMLTDLNRRRFWDAFLADDAEGVKACIRNAMTYLTRKVQDARLRQVVKDACDFALRHPERFTIRGGSGRRAYQGHTPNIVAFTVLMRSVHDFAEAHASPPIAFFHDCQEEFSSEMKEAYATFGSIRYEDHPRGAMPKIERVAYDLARFSMPSSRDMVVLQAADLLVWLSQRETQNEPVRNAQRRLAGQTSHYHISRAMSEQIYAARVRENAALPISRADEIRGRQLVSQMEQARLDRLREPRAERGN